MVHQNLKGNHSLFPFFSYSLHISNRQPLLKDSCIWTLGSLKNDPQQSCFFHPHNEIQYSWNRFSSLLAHSLQSQMCIYCVFSPCVHRLVRLAWVNGILKAHFQATQLITQGWRMTLPHVTCVKQCRVGSYLSSSKIGVRVEKYMPSASSRRRQDNQISKYLSKKYGMQI